MSDERISVWRLLIEPTGSNRRYKLVELNLTEHPNSLDETNKLLPNGAYTTFRTFEHFKAIKLDEHFSRLEETARLAGYPINLERDILRKALLDAVLVYPAYLELRLRLLVDLESDLGSIYLAAEPLHILPAQAYELGVRTVTCNFRRQNPKAKLTKTISAAAILRQNLPQDVNEALMLDDDGMILEGLSSNFFAVKSGVLWTAEEGILFGITRQTVLEEARAAEIEICLQGVFLNELGKLDEAFITSSSRAVLPVRQLDEQTIGNGRPGPLTRLLSERYAIRLSKLVEPI